MSDARASGRNVLITGIPRSGTTLTCHLLNSLPNTVALHEPLRPGSLDNRDESQLVSQISAFFAAQRESILATGTAVSKSADGGVPMNPLSDQVAQDGRRVKNINGRSIQVSNVTDGSFTLCIKQPSFLTACLPHLTKHFPCYAIVRNPLAVLLSWRVSGMNVSRGRAPGAERFDGALRAKLDDLTSVLDRQLALLGYFCQRYADYLPDRTIRYEDMVQSGGRALSIVTSSAHELNADLQSRNARGLDSDAEASVIADRLLGEDGPWWRWYETADVRRLISGT